VYCLVLGWKNHRDTPKGLRRWAKQPQPGSPTTRLDTTNSPNASPRSVSSKPAASPCATPVAEHRPAAAAPTPPQRHGPYYQWTAKVEGKTVTRRLSQTEADLYQEWIDNDRQLRALITQMRQIAAKATALIPKMPHPNDEPEV